MLQTARPVGPKGVSAFAHAKGRAFAERSLDRPGIRAFAERTPTLFKPARLAIAALAVTEAALQGNLGSGRGGGGASSSASFGSSSSSVGTGAFGDGLSDRAIRRSSGSTLRIRTSTSCPGLTISATCASRGW